MIERHPEKAKWAYGMPGGPDNPLGARALYLFQNGIYMLFRIHGTTEPMSIGKNASSGCIRMISQDVVELYRRVPDWLAASSSWPKGFEARANRATPRDHDRRRGPARRRCRSVAGPWFSCRRMQQAFTLYQTQSLFQRDR